MTVPALRSGGWCTAWPFAIDWLEGHGGALQMTQVGENVRRPVAAPQRAPVEGFSAPAATG